MASRFSDLERRLTAALKAGSTIDQLKADTNGDVALRNYVKWKVWQTPADHKRPAGSTRNTGGLVRVNITPFKIDVGSNVIQTTASKRTADATGTLVTTAKGKANWKTVPSGGIAMPGRSWYSPAQATVRSATTTSQTVAASENKITGREYKTRTKGQQGYIIPFGKTGTKTEFDVRKDINDALVALNTAYVISFKDEDANFVPEKGVVAAG